MKMKHKPIAYRNTTMLSMHPREIDPVTGRKIGGQYVYRNSKQQVEFELDSKLGDRSRRGDRRDGAPYYHHSAEPLSGSDSCQRDICWHLKQNIAKEEDAAAQAEFRVAEP